MPILPLDHPEPFAATLGVMLYPGTHETDRRKADAFTAQYLAEPIRRLHDAGGTLPYEDLAHIAAAAGERLNDLDARWWGGTATGEVLKAFFALANTRETLASKNNAKRVAETVAAQRRVSGSRSSLSEVWRKFLPVAHLWAAWRIREGRFAAEPSVGYDEYTDFLCYLAEAEALRNWGQNWHPPRAKGLPPLPADVWRTPDGWRAPRRMSGWPDTGRVPALTLPAQLLADLKPAGRPRKTA